MSSYLTDLEQSDPEYVTNFGNEMVTIGYYQITLSNKSSNKSSDLGLLEWEKDRFEDENISAVGLWNFNHIEDDGTKRPLGPYATKKIEKNFIAGFNTCTKVAFIEGDEKEITIKDSIFAVVLALSILFIQKQHYYLINVYEKKKKYQEERGYQVTANINLDDKITELRTQIEEEREEFEQIWRKYFDIEPIELNDKSIKDFDKRHNPSFFENKTSKNVKKSIQKRAPKTRINKVADKDSNDNNNNNNNDNIESDHKLIEKMYNMMSSLEYSMLKNKEETNNKLESVQHQIQSFNLMDIKKDLSEVKYNISESKNSDENFIKTISSLKDDFKNNVNNLELKLHNLETKINTQNSMSIPNLISISSNEIDKAIKDTQIIPDISSKPPVVSSSLLNKNREHEIGQNMEAQNIILNDVIKIKKEKDEDQRQKDILKKQEELRKIRDELKETKSSKNKKNKKLRIKVTKNKKTNDKNNKKNDSNKKTTTKRISKPKIKKIKNVKICSDSGTESDPIDFKKPLKRDYKEFRNSDIVLNNGNDNNLDEIDLLKAKKRRKLNDKSELSD